MTEAVRLLEECHCLTPELALSLRVMKPMELDACVMDGNTLKAGAVAGVGHLRNPVLAARLVMEQSPHVMMIGEGAKILRCSWHGARLAGDFLHAFAL